MAKDNKTIVIGELTDANSLLKELLAGSDYPVKLKITNQSANELVVSGVCNLKPCYDTQNSTVMEIKHDKDLRFASTMQGIANVRKIKSLLTVELVPDKPAIEKNQTKGVKSGN